MFKHILIPTDGSRLAAKGVRAGVRLAASLGARVTGVHVVAPYVPPLYGEAAVYVVALAPGEYKKISQKQAAKALAAVAAACRAHRVRCATRSLTAAQPWEGILRAARAQKCDAIVMASHGRSGLGGLLLGSETTRILAHSKIPVLVCR